MNTDAIRGKMAENRVSQRELAFKMGISLQSLNRKLLGKRGFTVEEASNMCNSLKIPMQERAEIFLT